MMATPIMIATKMKVFHVSCRSDRERLHRRDELRGRRDMKGAWIGFTFVLETNECRGQRLRHAKAMR